MPPATKDYRVRLIKDCPAINPQFIPSEEVSATNPRFIAKPAGTEITGPHAWMLCRPDAYFGDIKAEPLDEFTRRKVQSDQRRSAAMISEREKRLEAEREAKRKKKRRSR